jgi:energy-coupling factor transporter ATP-binding protein EcfA2
VISRFSVRDYKNLIDVDVGLTKINLLVGPNNSGKSNFIQALTFLRDAVAAGQPSAAGWHPALQRRGGWLDVTRRNSNAGLQLRWERADRIGYELSLRAGGAPPRADLESESLYCDGLEARNSYDAGWSIRSDDDVEATPNRSGWLSLLHGYPNGLSALPPGLEAARAELRRWSGRVANYNLARFVPFQMTSPVAAKESDEQLAEDGTNLANVLRRQEQEHVDGLASLRRRLQQVFPGLGRVWVADSSGSHRWVQFSIDQEKWTLGHLSDGSARMVALAALLDRPNTFDLLALDEPELNLHPAWQRIVARWVETSFAAEQVFLSTHSPEFLDGFTEGFRAGTVRLLAFNTEPGRPQVEEVPPDRFADAFDDGWTLGDVYRAGDSLLGGWPVGA